MRLFPRLLRLKSASRSITRIAACIALLALSVGALAQDLTPGLIYVCSGERLSIENCNIRDTSDTSTCMIGHPDHIQANGLMQYTTMTRGALKKLFPTCTQPTAKNSTAAHNFQKKQDDTYNANSKKANDQLNQIVANQSRPPVTYGQPKKPRTAEERAINRCITSGRLPASCTGNMLLGAFSSMLTSVLPSVSDSSKPHAGPIMAGVFEGAGHWRLDFVDGGVLVNCSYLAPNQESYSLDFQGAHPALVVHTKPKPLVLAVHADGTITGPGPVTLQGVIASGASGGQSTPGHDVTQTTTTHETVNKSQAGSYNQSDLTYQGNGTYDAAHTTTSTTHVAGAPTPTHSTFSARTVTCPAVNLTSKGASVGMQTMQTDLLKTMFGGDKGPPTPPGLRMQGIYAASTGFSVQFFPESAILGCGPDAARAYPYTVEAGSGGAIVKIIAPDHPLSLAMHADGSLDPGSGPYQVHGRTITGQNDNDDFTFAPAEQTCNLAALAPASAIPSNGGTATASPTATASGHPANPATLSTQDNVLGNAILNVVPGLPGTPSPLAGRPYLLLRHPYATIVAQSGGVVPAGTSPFKYTGTGCAGNTAVCQQISTAVKADVISAARADATGHAALPGVPPGTYYLMISTRYNNQPVVWSQAVQLHAGANSITLDARSATPIN